MISVPSFEASKKSPYHSSVSAFIDECKEFIPKSETILVSIQEASSDLAALLFMSIILF